ncbi:Histone transcription regulator 3 [Coemansia umbellata]|uniref:Histone transcription regulator 3 n=1 Tax=Coemansia umbellata TaxID=1424467 RepID=A0ABQ8PP56_9FUNG|nr:Histone transcription regulator 3 [Coemansia umbellata]
MPVFVPVNPPPVPENAGADALDSTISATPLLRIEEQIRNLVDEYKVALKAWADGQLEEAFRKFDALCNHSLLSQPQETPIEQECTAYSSEYGGMDINYLRALVFMNAGRLHIISNGGPDVCTSLESLGNLESIDSQTAPLFNNKAVLRKAFAFFMEALRFGNADASRYLAIGQCALYASVSSKSSEDMLFTHVQFSINQVKHPEASTDPVCASDEIADGSLGSVVEDGNIKLSDATNATSNGPDESGGDESTRGVKRRGSQSEDEIPVKRRSTRFIERATLGSMGSSSGTGVSNQVQGAVGSTRTAPSRSNVRRALTMAFEPIESPAMQTGCELANTCIEDASSICGYMRADWTQLMKGATDMHGLAMDELCIRQYRLVESWSEYEASVITGNMERAKASILECRRLIQQASYEAERPEIVVCSFSRAPITLSLIERRLEHLSLFTKLHEAEQLAANDPNSAAALLDSAIKPFSENVSNALAFSQTISATRLLSSLHNKLGNTRKETAAIMYELYLYISRMLASDENADSSLPARQLVEHCVDCLRRIQQLSNSDDLVYQSLSSSNMSKPLRYFVAQLVTLSLGFSGYFATDPPGECPAVSLEARFIGMSIWLAAALTSKANIVQFEPPQLDSVLAVNIETNSTPTSDATVPTDASAGSVEVPDIRMQFMSSIHSLLGERGLCTAAHGALLLHLLSVCNNCLRFDKDNAVCWDMAAACLRCLFDIKLHGSDAEMHLCEHIDMDETAANLVFTLIEADLLDTLRSRKGTGLRSDLKAIVDKTGSVLGDIDTAKYPRLGMNMDIIDDYLDGLSMPSFAQVESALCSERDVKVPVACLPVKEGIKDSGILPAYLTLPFVRAITQHELLLARMRSGHSRPVEEYDNIIEDYKLNVALNPESPEAWYHLGQAHSDLANELLLGTASEILGSKYDIAVLQRAAVSCAIQAKQLLSSPDNMRSLSGLCDKAFVEDEESGESALYEQTRKLHIRVYSFTGNLLYRIASRPLSLLAFQILPSNVLISDGADSDEERQEWDVGKWKASGVVDGNFSNTNSTADAITRSLTRRFVAAPSHQRIYKITRRLLANAVRLDSTNWRWVYMLGKAMAKLNDTLSACACYLKAVYLAIAANGKHSALSTSSCAWPTHGPGSNTAASYQIAISNVPEAAMNAVYKLLSTLAKHLYSSSINADTAIRFIESLPFSAVGGTSVNEKPDARFASSGPIEPKSKAVLGTIYSLANQVCAADKRRWHHRLVYLLAWIGHSVMGESEQAKQTLQTLLQTRSSNRQLASFYKPDFEAPGKHYLYLEKYTGLYIDVLIATSDIEGVQNLLRKLKRCSDFLFDSPALLLRANSAEAATLQKMVHDLNCPRFVVDGLGKEHIVLQNALSGASDTQEFSVTRHCRLNRTQFNCARDFARDNISFFVAFQEHISNILAAIEKKKPETNGNADKASGSSTADSTISATDKVEKAQKAIEQYLDTATKAMSLFDLLLEQKKKYSEDADMLSKLNDNLADLYILVLSSYGQERISILIHPHQADDVDELVSMCRKLAAQLASLQALKRPSGSFWQRILFDEASNESSQQYKLLDPLLEFNINKLLDSIRDARALQPNPFVRNKPRSDIVQQAPQAARVASVSSNPDIPS